MLLHFLTSKTGLVAAIVVLLGLVSAVAALARSVISYARGRPRLRIMQLELSDLAPWGPSCEMRLQLGNSGGSNAVMRSLLLKVIDHSDPGDKKREIKIAAPLQVYESRVELNPDKSVYDIRGRTFLAERPPLAFDSGEVVAFLVKVVSRTPQWYQLIIEAEWYDPRRPKRALFIKSKEFRLEFPNEITKGHL